MSSSHKSAHAKSGRERCLYPTYAFQLSQVSLEDLHLTDSPLITFRIEVKETAKNVGGVTLFGKDFGNAPQDILFNLYYSESES